MKEFRKVRTGIFALVLACAGVLASAQNTGLQAKNTKTYNGHKYALYENGCTWEQAKQYCQQLGGHLVTITSGGEEEVVEALVKTGSKNSYWLGGYKVGEKKFAWVTGESFSYTHWLGWQPDDFMGLEDRVAMSNKILQPGGWNDVRADGECNGEAQFGARNFGFICEWDNGSSSNGGQVALNGSADDYDIVLEEGDSFKLGKGTWKSSNSSVIKISKNGKALVVGEGIATLTSNTGKKLVIKVGEED